MALGLPAGGIKIAGHKVPWEAVAAVAAVASVLLVIRARQQQQNVASVGAAPLTAASTGFGLPLPSTDPGAALANLSQQLTQIQQQGLQGPAPAAAGPAPAISPTLSGQLGALLSGGDPAGLYGFIKGVKVFGEPVWGASGNQADPLAVVPIGSVLPELGAPGPHGQAVQLPDGQVGYVNPGQISGTVPLGQQVPIH